MKLSLKTLLSFVLALSFLTPVILAVNARTAGPVLIWVASDIHYRPQSMLGPLEEQNNFPADPFYRHANTTGQLTYETEAVTNAFLKRFEASSSQILLIPGDLTDDGYLPEHTAFAQKLKDFEAKTGKRVFVVNGNHDIRRAVSDRSIDLNEFKTIYADFGFAEALVCHENSASYTADLEGDYRLIAIDAVVHGTDTSVIDSGLLSWIQAQVLAAKEDGKHLIGMIHYSILEHFQNQSIAEKYIMVENYRGISSKLADWGIKYVFTGHVHGNDISAADSANGNRIYDVETSSLLAYPNTYREVAFSDESVKIESRNIDEINTADLVAGYSAQQLDLIENNFQAYSLGFFKASMNYFINRYIGSPGSIAGALNIEKGTVAYDALSAVMTTLGAALNLPIYDEDTPETDSVEEIAAEAGETIDRSEYKNLPDIIGSILAAHYSGIENIPYDSPEIRLFKQCFKAALVHSLVNIPDAAAKALCEELGVPMPAGGPDNGAYTNAAKLIYMKTAAGKIINELVEPLLRGFTSDSYSPGDLNVTLEAYGAPGEPAAPKVPIAGMDFMIDIFTRLTQLIIHIAKTLLIF